MLPEPIFSNFMYSFDIVGLLQLVGFNVEIKSQLISVINAHNLFLLRLAVNNRYEFLLLKCFAILSGQINRKKKCVLL